MDLSSSNIKEEEYPLTSNSLDYDKERLICAKNLLVRDQYQRYWQPSLNLGQACWEYVVGDYFSKSEEFDYQQKEKILIKIPGLINKVNSLEALQLAGRRNGVVVPVRGENAPDKETMNYVLGAIQRANNVPDLKTECFTDAMVTSYPSFLFFDKDYSWDRSKTVCMYHEPWNSILIDPMFRNMDLSDCKRIIRQRKMTLEEMIYGYKKRSEITEKHFKDRSYIEDFSHLDISSTDRDKLYSSTNLAKEEFDETGRMTVIESLFFIYTQMEIYIDPKTDDLTMVPPEWTFDQKRSWLAANPGLKTVKRDVRVLWTTTSTASGLLLENNKHWFQMNEYPCEMYIPKLWNGKPHGIIEFLRGTTKAEAVARIEHLHSLRHVNDDLMIVQANSIENPDDLPIERTRVGGTIVTKENVPVSEAVYFPNMGKRENVAWMEFAKDMQNNTDRLSTNPNFEGTPETSQESGEAIKTRNAATAKKFSPFLNTYHTFDLRVTRKLAMTVPILVNEHEIFRHIDKNNNPIEVEVNKPVEYDLLSGEPSVIVNNLKGAKYDYIPAVIDDSLSAREQEIREFIEIFREVISQAPQEVWIPLLESAGNRFAMLMAEGVKKAQEELKDKKPVPEPMKTSLSINSEDIMHNQILQQILADQGILKPEMLQALAQQLEQGQQQQQQQQPQRQLQGVV